MKTKYWIKRILIVFLWMMPMLIFAQDNSKPTKAQKKADKKKEQQLKQKRKDEIAGKKFHYKIQDKKTRKRMKKHRKHVDKSAPY
jgi:hypothetical protein